MLDVSKAHRRIKKRPEDQGLLCFHHRDKLYQCLTLNFGARASSYYWSRCAGLLCRLLHRLLFVNHALMIYVDDLLCLLRKCASPLLSWHKASLSSQPVWIGWHIDLLTGTVQMESAKQQRILALLQQVLDARHVSRHDVEKLTGKLLLRPTLAPLYALQHAGQTVMAALTLDQWSALRGVLDADLIVRGTINHPSVPLGSRLLRLARLPLSCLADVPDWLPESRRVWVQVSHHQTPSVPVTAEVREVLSLWKDFMQSPTCQHSVRLAPTFACEAFADACADARSVGLGGYVKFPCGSKRFFQVTLSRAALRHICPFMDSEASPQIHCLIRAARAIRACMDYSGHASSGPSSTACGSQMRQLCFRGRRLEGPVHGPRLVLRSSTVL